MSVPRRAVVLGGTGAIGGAVAARLAARGWRVQVTGREPGSMPRELAGAGVRFRPVHRDDVEGIRRLVDDGVDLLVDALAFGAEDVQRLLPVMARAASVVVVSSRAVYVDGCGRHLNGAEPPRFEHRLTETDPTLGPAAPGTSPFSRLGYGPSKVAVERTALDSGLPVTVIRPSKVHGRWARQPRTRTLVERMLAGDTVIPLADRGTSVDHLTAAANAAALVEHVAEHPGSRILNVADPDTPTAAELVGTIGRTLGWAGRVDLLPPGHTGGEHPWHVEHPVVLDTSAAAELGYRPVGSALALLPEEVEWVAAGRRAGPAMGGA